MPATRSASGSAAVAMMSAAAVLCVLAAAFLVAILTAGPAGAATRRAPAIGLKEIHYAREPVTSLRAGRTASPLSPQQAKERLEARGLRDVTTPLRRGRFAIMAATAPRGERVTLVIDLVSGEISGARLQALPDPADKKR